MPIEFFYGYPFAIFLLFALPLFLFLFFMLMRYRQEKVKMFPHLKAERSLFLFWLRVALLCVAWGSAVFALMDPKGNPRYPEGKKEQENQSKETPQRQRSKEVIFLLDDSASMAVKDMRTGKSRFESAKETIDQVVSALNGEAISLYTFTSEVDKRVPATTDYIFIRLLLRQLEINDGDSVGTNIIKAVKTVEGDYEGLASEVYKYIILLSDGEDTALEGVSKQEIDKIIEPLILPPEAHFTLYSIGIGTVQGGIVPDLVYEGKPVHSSLKPLLLRALAMKSGGRYEELNATTAHAIAKKLAKNIQEDSPFLSPHELTISNNKESITVVYDSYYEYPLMLAILALLAALFVPDRFQRTKS